jgi:hypothetical protein
VNAPDLYIPLMGAGTYCLLICLAAAQRRKFKPELMTTAVSTTFAAWTAHTALLKVLLRCLRKQGCVHANSTLARSVVPWGMLCSMLCNTYESPCAGHRTTPTTTRLPIAVVCMLVMIRRSRSCRRCCI